MHQFKIFKACFFAVFLICFWSISLHAQDPRWEDSFADTIHTEVDLFEVSGPLDMTLTFDIKNYQRKKNDDEYVPVELHVALNDSTEARRDVRVKARGAFRKSTCHFAPFWLNIRKANVENKYLQDVKKMKVVTRCRSGLEYDEYILLEFLAYKIYNLLSPNSFRVRLINMKYVDTGRKDKETVSWAFMIEPESMLAERVGGLVIKNDELAMAFTRPEEMLIAALFQYMIGNADYSIAGRHNMKILGMPGFGTEGYTPVPYDFDYAGLVNASYAVPGENLGLTSVTQRYYLGPCRENSEYLAAMAHLENHRDEILELLQSFPYLGEKAKSSAIAYIESYYTAASNEKFIGRNLKSTCR